MANFLAQIRIPAVNARPEDAVVNTLHFAGVAADLPDVTASLISAYSGSSAAGQVPLAASLSGLMDTPAARVKYYDLAHPIPRAPVRDDPLPLTATTGNNTLPQEVALVLSFEALPASGLQQKRRRGRVYFGPFANGMAAPSTGRPHPDLITRVRHFGLTLLNASAAAPWEWIVWSKVNNTGAPVQRGWVDDAWDTQRRRGIAPLTRSVFPAP